MAPNLIRLGGGLNMKKKRKLFVFRRTTGYLSRSRQDLPTVDDCRWDVTVRVGVRLYGRKNNKRYDSVSIIYEWKKNTPNSEYTAPCHYIAIVLFCLRSGFRASHDTYRSRIESFRFIGGSLSEIGDENVNRANRHGKSYAELGVRPNAFEYA